MSEDLLIREHLLAELLPFLEFHATAECPAGAYACFDYISKGIFSRAASERHSLDRDQHTLIINALEAPLLTMFFHVDTVPGYWTPFVEGDLLFARGALDMRGPTWAVLSALRDEETESSKPSRVDVVLTSDEETGGHSLEALLGSGAIRSAPMAFTPDAGGHGGLVVAQKGACFVRMRSKGVAGHSSRPWLAVNPVLDLVSAIQQITHAFPVVEDSWPDWQQTVTVTQLCGSEAPNQIGNEATAVLDIRYPSGISKADAINRVRRALPVGIVLDDPFIDSIPLDTDASHPVVRLFEDAILNTTGRAAAVVGEHGASDARRFQEAGIPAFLYGACGAGAHSDREHVSVSSLVNLYKITRCFLRNLANADRLIQQYGVN